MTDADLKEIMKKHLLELEECSNEILSAMKEAVQKAVAEIFNQKNTPMSGDSQKPTFEQAIAAVINSYSKENESDTPDYILAQYVSNCLEAYKKAIMLRDSWFGVDMWAEDKRSEEFHKQKALQ